MKKVVAVAFLVLFSVALVDIGNAAPSLDVYEEPELDVFGSELEPTDEPQEERGVRHRRVTCDLMSVNTPYGSFGHSACAAHCLAMMRGFRGGRCINGVCNCRR